MVGILECVRDDAIRDLGEFTLLDGPIRAMHGVLDALEAMEGMPLCCTEGCERPAAPRRLHCERHCRDYVRFKDGRALPITVDALAMGEATRVVGSNREWARSRVGRDGES